MKTLITFEYPPGSTWEGQGRLVDPGEGRAIRLDRSGPDWSEHPSDNAAEAATLVYESTVAACAELVRAAGCFCSRSNETEPDGWIEGLDPVEYEPFEIPEPLRVKIHHPRCPQALAAQIEARGGK